MNPFCALFIF